MTFARNIEERLAELASEHRLRDPHHVSGAQGPELVVDGRPVIGLCSNNYLGLTSHPKVKEAAIRATEKYGTGCAGSRLLNGTLDIHVQVSDEQGPITQVATRLLGPVREGVTP